MRCVSLCPLTAASEFFCLVVWPVGSPSKGFLMSVPTVFTTCDTKDIFHNLTIDSRGYVSLRSEIFLWCSNLQSLVTSGYRRSVYYCLSPLGLITRLLSTRSLHPSWLRLTGTALLWSAACWWLRQCSQAHISCWLCFPVSFPHKLASLHLFLLFWASCY